MITKRKIAPGGPGTKKLLEKYGDRLVCVRYRYDANKSERIKTVELVLDRVKWKAGKNRIHPNKKIEIIVQYNEMHLRKIIKSAGGKWNPKKKTWELPYREVKALGLEGRMKCRPP